MQHSSLLCEWESRVLDYRRSGLKAAEWCALNGFPVPRLKYWITKVNRISKDTDTNQKNAGSQNGGLGWAAVEIVDTHIESKIAICIGSARIEVSSGFDKSLLSDVLQVVTRSC
jgi:hypothetical protein